MDTPDDELPERFLYKTVFCFRLIARNDQMLGVNTAGEVHNCMAIALVCDAVVNENFGLESDTFVIISMERSSREPRFRELGHLSSAVQGRVKVTGFEGYELGPVAAEHWDLAFGHQLHGKTVGNILEILFGLRLNEYDMPGQSCSCAFWTAIFIEILAMEGLTQIIAIHSLAPEKNGESIYTVMGYRYEKDPHGQKFWIAFQPGAVIKHGMFSNSTRDAVLARGFYIPDAHIPIQNIPIQNIVYVTSPYNIYKREVIYERDVKHDSYPRYGTRY